MKSDETIRESAAKLEIKPALEVPVTVVVRNNLRFDVPAVASQAAALDPDCLVEVKIISVNGETLIPPPHPYVARIQHHNFNFTIPKLPAQIMQLKPGDCINAYIRRID